MKEQRQPLIQCRRCHETLARHVGRDLFLSPARGENNSFHRSRKIKCIATRAGESCERCLERNLRCSYTTPPGASRRSPGPFRINTLSGHSPSSTKNSATPGLRYRLVEPQAGYDIGSGTPPEILRESELVQELLLLYFNNFSDIHFMFDRDSFLRQLAVGEAPKVILYSMMALGIK